MSRRRGSLIMKLKKTVSAVLAGAMLLGTSAFAKDNIYAYNKTCREIAAQIQYKKKLDAEPVLKKCRTF